MRELLLRILRRSLPVVLALGVLGYLFGEVYLVLIRRPGVVVDPAINDVKWRAPLTFAGFGLGIMVVVEVFSFVLRGKQPPAPRPPAPRPPAVERTSSPPAAAEKAPSESVDP